VREGKSDSAARDIPMASRVFRVFKRPLSNAKGEHLFPRRVGHGYDWTRPMTELRGAGAAKITFQRMDRGRNPRRRTWGLSGRTAVFRLTVRHTRL